MKVTSLPFAAALVTGLASTALAHEQALEGSEWGVAGDLGDAARYVSFAGSNRIFGFGGCNRFSGTYQQNDTELTIAPLAATRKACEPDVMSREDAFLTMLQKVRGVRVDHTLLLLLDENGADIKALIRRDAE